MISLVRWTVIVILFELGGSLNVTNETSAGQLLTNVVPCSTRQKYNPLALTVKFGLLPMVTESSVALYQLIT